MLDSENAIVIANILIVNKFFTRYFPGKKNYMERMEEIFKEISLINHGFQFFGEHFFLIRFI